MQLQIIRNYDMFRSKAPFWAKKQIWQKSTAMDAGSPLPESVTQRTVARALAIVRGQHPGIRGYLSFGGPAVIASIAYMDPGNFATNIQAGAKYGYTLLWVVLLASLIAMLFQALSAKLGIVTGRNLAEMCRDRFPKPIVWAMWVVSEIAAMATDLAEFLGGAIGLALLFKMPLIAGMVVTAIVTYGILMVEGRGFRPVELIIGSFVAIIALCYLVEMFIAPVDWGAAALGIARPQLADAGALLLAVGIIGATVMPHAVYLHSGLTQGRIPAETDDEKRVVVRISNWEVLVALAAAGLVNIAMVMMASSAFHSGHSDVSEIGTAYHTMTPQLGNGAASVFLLSLIASGISSSVVGTMAGQMIMQGFVGFRIPIWLRRAITMAPAFVVVGYGVNATTALVVSQVVLSIALPLPMVALLIFTARQDVMGAFVNRLLVNVAAAMATVIVLALNVVLILDTFGLPVLAF
jgi:manganese transport protein